MQQTIKIRIDGKSRKGNTKKKHLIIFSAPDHMSMEKVDSFRNGMKEFEENGKSVAVMCLPPEAKFKVIHF